MKRRTVTWLAASGGLVLVLAACSGSGGEATGDDRTGDPAPRAAPAPSGSDPAPSVEPAEVPEAFRFSAPALDGGQVVGADYAATGVALWFWAPW